MLCASNHITVSRKLMFLAWSLLIRMFSPQRCTAAMVQWEKCFFLTMVEVIVLFFFITLHLLPVPVTFLLCSVCLN